MADLTRTTLLIVLAAGLGAGAAWFYLAKKTEPPPAAVTPPAPPPIVAPPAAPEASAPVEPGKPEPDGLLLLPDGSRVAPLNGVTNPPRLLWQNPEWSPIVRKEHNAGLDWYVHADGSYSTTQWIWRQELGRLDATSFSLHPRQPVPLEPSAGEPVRR